MTKKEQKLNAALASKANLMDMLGKCGGLPSKKDTADNELSSEDSSPDSNSSGEDESDEKSAKYWKEMYLKMKDHKKSQHKNKKKKGKKSSYKRSKNHQTNSDNPPKISAAPVKPPEVSNPFLNQIFVTNNTLLSH